jgi:hypothetical protein
MSKSDFTPFCPSRWEHDLVKLAKQPVGYKPNFYVQKGIVKYRMYENNDKIPFFFLIFPLPLFLITQNIYLINRISVPPLISPWGYQIFLISKKSHVKIQYVCRRHQPSAFQTSHHWGQIINSNPQHTQVRFQCILRHRSYVVIGL